MYDLLGFLVTVTLVTIKVMISQCFCVLLILFCNNSGYGDNEGPVQSEIIVCPPADQDLQLLLI